MALPFMPLLLIGVFILLLASLVGSVLRLIIRILFRPIRFVVCFFIVLALLALVSYSLYNNPILPGQSLKGTKEEAELTIEETALSEVSNLLKGVFKENLPLLAWRMQTVDGAEQGIPEGLYQLGTMQPVYVKIEYLPVGSITAAYQPLTGKVSIVQGIDDGVNNSFLSSLLEPFADTLPMGLMEVASS